MKNITLIILFLSLLIRTSAQPCINVPETCNDDCGLTYCGPYELSKGIYRIPFVDGTSVEVVCDHRSHCPRGRIDMIGTDGDFNGDYHIAAAADGWIRAIVDNHFVQCDCSQSSCENNYVWIEHPNGEWTKYTHFRQGSVTILNHFIGEFVTAGTNLGNEGDVGCAAGFHLHFEAAQPIDTNTLVFSESGGYIDEDWAKNVIPVFCNISGNVMNTGEEFVAADCPASCAGSIGSVPQNISIGEYDVVLNGNAISNDADYKIEEYGAGLFQAANEIILNVGFEVLQNATFDARIADCDESPLKNSAVQESSIKELNESGWEIYPNPAGEKLFIEFSESGSVNQLVIQNMLGKIIYSEVLKSDEQALKELDVHSLPAGVYLLTISCDVNKAVQRFVKD